VVPQASTAALQQQPLLQLRQQMLLRTLLWLSPGVWSSKQLGVLLQMVSAAALLLALQLQDGSSRRHSSTCLMQNLHCRRMLLMLARQQDSLQQLFR
jgi:hypothetical protein